MKKLIILGKEILAWGSDTPQLVDKKSDPLKVISAPDNGVPTKKALPPGRSSYPPQQNQYIPDSAESQILLPEFFLGVIPVIRKLASSNQNISQALNNIVELGNTGHNIQFDSEVPEDQIVKMRQHIEMVSKTWSIGAVGVNGLVGKMMSQVMISGALSNEWVIKMDLSGIRQLAFVNPETVRWSYDHKKTTYKAHQWVNGYVLENLPANNMVELNPNTFKYFALPSDTDSPYGIPPYLAALDPLETQKMMMDNIKFLVKQVGIAGFMEMLLEKPDQEPNENTDAYIVRLEQFLVEAKKRVVEGFRDGVTVGYKGDAEFKFHSTTKAFGGVNEFFVMNELLFGSGLKMDMSMLGRNYGTTESQISIVFTKLLSQLKGIQEMCATNLEYGYALELRLAGYSFKTLKVKFNPSTALDELKYQQALEIKIRNFNQLYTDGIISQEQYAHGVGYEKPNQSEPRFVPTSLDTPQNVAAAKIAENAGKKVGAKAARKKGKPQEKIK